MIPPMTAHPRQHETVRIRRTSCSRPRSLLHCLVAVMSVVVTAGTAVTVATGTTARPAGALSLGGMSFQPSSTPAFHQDAPDPDVVVSGSTYYAFTTGTPLGNHLQALVDTSGSPASGWRSFTGQSYGSSALPVVPAWQQINTQTSPAVLHWGGHWLLYYNASQAGHAAGHRVQLPLGGHGPVPHPIQPGVHRQLHPALVVSARPGRLHRSECLHRSGDRLRLPHVEVQRRRFRPTRRTCGPSN